MKVDDELFLSLLDQGIDVGDVAMAYGRREHPDLDAKAPDRAYSDGFLDGVRAFGALLPLLVEGPDYDPAEFWQRLYDPDVLPVTRR